MCMYGPIARAQSVFYILALILANFTLIHTFWTRVWFELVYIPKYTIVTLKN